MASPIWACHSARRKDWRRTPHEMVDLYPMATEAVWPTRDDSVKTLARYLGFEWRDADPSGTSSADWFDQWMRTADPAIRERIKLYNEDDCIAMRVLADGLVGMRRRHDLLTV